MSSLDPHLHHLLRWIRARDWNDPEVQFELRYALSQLVPEPLTCPSCGEAIPAPSWSRVTFRVVYKDLAENPPTCRFGPNGYLCKNGHGELW